MDPATTPEPGGGQGERVPFKTTKFNGPNPIKIDAGNLAIDYPHKRLVVLPFSQSSYGGSLACSVCALYVCYYVISSRYIGNWYTSVLGEAFQMACADWNFQIRENNRPHLQNTKEMLPFSGLSQHVKIVSEHYGMMVNGYLEKSTTYEKELGTLTVTQLFENLTLLSEEKQNVVCSTFCKGQSGAYVAIIVDSQGYYALIDSHPVGNPLGYHASGYQDHPGGFVFESTTQEDMVDFMEDRFGKFISEDQLFEINQQFLFSEHNFMKGEDWSLTGGSSNNNYECYTIDSTK